MFQTKDEKLIAIHKASMEILSKCGMKFLHPALLEAIEKNGIRVEGDVAYFTEDDILKWVEKAPASFTLYARNEAYNMEVGGDNVYYCPGCGSSNISDEKGEKRRAHLGDFKNLLKLYHSNPDYFVNGGLLVQPDDFTASVPALMQYLSILYSDKCLFTVPGTAKEVGDSLALTAAVFGGKEAMMEKPRAFTIANTNTPLQFDYRMSETLLEYAAYRQPISITAASMAGTTSPVTLAGTLALSNAEIISVIAVAQMLAPGLPVVYGSQTCAADLKTGQIAIGSPEGALCYEYAAKLAKAYGLPCRGGGALSDAKTVGAQSGMESMLTLLATAGAGMNLIFQSSGILDGYNAFSYEKLISDFETIRMVRRYLHGVDVDENHLAVSAVEEVGIAGEFMTSMHTFANMRSEVFVPDLASRGTVMGNPDEVYCNKIKEKCNGMLESYVKPEISEEALHAMNGFMNGIGFDDSYLAELGK